MSRRVFLSATAGMLALPTLRAQAADVFDYIVIGAGSAGCVAVNRLTSDPSIRVLLIEAGGPGETKEIHDNGRWTALLGSGVDWNFRTEPEPGLGGRQIACPRGKVLGGSSAINAMAYVRGHRLDYARWQAAAGPEWAFDALLPYFIASEDNSRGPSELHGRGGPLAVSDTTDPHAAHQAFLAAAREQGFEADPAWDFNGARQEGGAGFYQKNLRDGRRHSAAAAFLTPILARPNLAVHTRSQVLRLLVENGRVTGVEYAGDRGVERARAAREVILAAGVIETPKILLLSGLGPAGALKTLGIPIVADIPGVGAELHDHPRVSVRWEGTGELPGSSVSAGLFARSSTRASNASPDLHFYVGRGLSAPDAFVTITVALGSPESRGTVTLGSADPQHPPRIQMNYLTAVRDVDALVDGVELARALGESRAFTRLRGRAVLPEAPARTRPAIREFLRQTADTMFHPVGTCRMGNDDHAVVDGELCVRGVEGLRIADASIMPSAVNGPTHAACVMIGQKVSALLLGASPRP